MSPDRISNQQSSSGPSTLKATPGLSDDVRLPIFYGQLAPVDPARHTGRSLKSNIGYEFARNSHALPLNGVEFESAACSYPIVFTPPPNPAALAMVGLRRETNQFVDLQGGWRLASYIPAYVRRYPFIFHESADKRKYTLCIDETAGALEEGSARPLFLDGKPTELVNNALQFCAAFQRDHAATREFVEQMNEYSLLSSNQAEITLNSGEKLTVAGFYIVDRDRFAGLPDSVFLKWRRKGWLAWVIAHFVSQGNWAALVDLAGSAQDWVK